MQAEKMVSFCVRFALAVKLQSPFFRPAYCVVGIGGLTVVSAYGQVTMMHQYNAETVGQWLKQNVEQAGSFKEMDYRWLPPPAHLSPAMNNKEDHS
jgi:hypothetical protein